MAPLIYGATAPYASGQVPVPGDLNRDRMTGNPLVEKVEIRNASSNFSIADYT